MRLVRFALIVLFMTLAVAAVASVAVTPASRPVFTPQLQDRLDRFMTETMASAHAPGMILGIWVPDSGAFVRAKGLSDIAARTPMRVTDTFRIGSMTKTFTSTVILQLVDAGRLTLDEAINTYTRASVATSLIPAIPAGDNITIRMLLNHTSGLANYSELPALDAKIDQRFVSFTPQQLVEAAIKEKPDFAPGTGYTYSNTNTVILGMLAEQLTQQPLQDEIARRFMVPLRMTQTSFPTTSVFIPGAYSHGYYQKDAKATLVDWTAQDVSWAWAAGAMTSNLDDLHTWTEALVGGGLLSPALQRTRMTAWGPFPISKQLPSLRYGFNVFTLGSFVGHNGGLPGFVCMAMRNLTTGDTIIFMLNAQTPTGDTVKILATLLPILYPEITL